jgi:hypothetical protein
MNEEAEMDARNAAVIMQEARKRAESQLQVRHPALFAALGAVYLFGFGAIWLSVRGQRPYQGPSSAALAPITVVGTLAVIVIAIAVGRATSGVSGASARRRRLQLGSLILGYAGVFALEGGLNAAGASRPVLGVFGAAAPILITGLVLAASSAVSLDRPVFGVGLWLMIVAAVGAYAGPVGVWAVGALAGGLALLLMAAASLVRRPA